MPRRRAVDASKYMQKYFNFDATFVRKPMPLLETWLDVVMNVILAEPITEAFKIQPCSVYLFHIFTQGKPKQLTLVSIGALHTFHIVINMYVNLNIIQYSQICASITHIKTLHV